MKRKAVFFDRDDTLIVDEGYMHRPEQLKFFPDTFSALKKIQEKGYLIFIITNQSGIGRGFFSLSDMHRFNEHMLKELKKYKIDIKEIVFCPHAPEDMCDCRKPSPKLLNELIDKYNIDISQSYMVGDKISDAEAGINAGLTSLLIKSHLEKVKTFQTLSALEKFLK
jgi:D-glycero-D-manno-heptose 1,7-bisphosphate phosphatase